MFYHSHINGCCQKVLPSMTGATMGITYDTDVANWDVPGTEWYVPKPADISCDAVDSYIALLNDYINQWQKRLYDATHTLIKNNTKIHNAQFMVNALNQRLGEYQVRKDVCMNPPPPPPPDPVIDETGTDGNGTDGSGSGGSTPWLLIVGGALGAAFLLRRRSRQSKNRRLNK